jgi:hypothetical protein
MPRFNSKLFSSIWLANSCRQLQSAPSLRHNRYLCQPLPDPLPSLECNSPLECASKCHGMRTRPWQSLQQHEERPCWYHSRTQNNIQCSSEPSTQCPHQVPRYRLRCCNSRRKLSDCARESKCKREGNDCRGG